VTFIETQRIGRLENQGEFDLIETLRIGRLEDQGEFDVYRNTENWTLGGPRRI
jgi:hypothetical protein